MRMTNRTYSIGAASREIDITRDMADASVEIGDVIHGLFPDLITEEDAILMGEDVFEGLIIGNPFQYIVTPCEIKHFRVS